MAIIHHDLLVKAFAEDMVEWHDREIKYKGDANPTKVRAAVLTKTGVIGVDNWMQICVTTGDFFIER